MIKEAKNKNTTLQKTIEEMDNLMHLIKMQIDILEKMGFNEKNMEKIIGKLSADQKNKLIEINKTIELIERRQIQNSIKRTQEQIAHKNISQIQKSKPKKNKQMILV